MVIWYILWSFWYILWPFGILYGDLVFFPFLVRCTMENLATRSHILLRWITIAAVVAVHNGTKKKVFPRFFSASEESSSNTETLLGTAFNAKFVRLMRVSG
jgi:hypothetical protein